MARIFLYEDTSGCLYLHREGDPDVYAHVETWVTYGATFETDAAELASGVQGDRAAERIPYAELTAGAGEPTMQRIAVWEDGRVQRSGHPGRDALLYLKDPRDQNALTDGLRA